MTRQEAIKEIELIKALIEWEYPLEYQIAFDMAIKALEQEPCEYKRTDKRTETHACDCISRQDAIDAVVYDGITTLNADERKLLIEQIPLAEPKWIPCSERLPEVSNKRMLISGSVNLGGMEHISTDIARYTDRGWILEGNNEPKECETITAWMPLPEPYKESDEECC